MQYKLNSLGYNAKMLRKELENNGGIVFKILKWAGLYNIVKKTKRRIFREIKAQKLNDFIEYNYSITTVNSQQELDRVVESTDCFLTGSDQIWNTYVSFKPFFFLDFAANKKRVAYASSIGANGIKEEYKRQVKDLLLKFSHIGVREKQAVDALTQLTDRNDIRQVLDPTFLLTPGDWRKMSQKPVFEIEIPQKYMLCYLIGKRENYAKQLLEVKRTLGIGNVLIIPSLENPDFYVDGCILYKDAGPVEFVNLIYNAQFVCTDSFHATALSINLGKNFVEFLRFDDDNEASQNSRIYDVLGHYGLENRMYSDSNSDWSAAIDFAPIQEILANDRKSSEEFLISSIEG